MGQRRPPADGVDPVFRVGLTVLLAAIAAFGAIDLVLDRPESPWSFHVLFEITFVALCLGSVFLLWRGWAGANYGLVRSQQDLRDREAERDHWRTRATRLLDGLGAEIEAQFDRWSLTPTEKEVALLLLKGLGHKEAATVMNRSERTVRQHAVAVYKKSGLSGRAELSAFFLEDLLLPHSQPAD
ncbi:MAG: LuxR family transcriptional regulator [Deltaproteobacteria bacterium]|nr:LuxR family transcriptional regulator [Deltaproteobacteria bacterium]MBW2401763.1 LuxR family transcriptional regulator [Deltaproteobacteria bacterium]MBW2668130.1 LuxR family transcriptional regulator [Deltaproteobacteria bacterium]